MYTFLLIQTGVNLKVMDLGTYMLSRRVTFDSSGLTSLGVPEKHTSRGMKTQLLPPPLKELSRPKFRAAKGVTTKKR